MRKKNRNILNGALIGGTTVSIIDIILQYFELREQEKQFNWENYDGLRTLKRGLLGAGGGAMIGYGVYRYNIFKQSRRPYNSEEYLKTVLNNSSIKNDSALFTEVLKVREEIKQIIDYDFGNQLASKPFDAGSFAKRTANNSNFDIDIIIPFSKKSQLTTEEIFTHVYNSLNRNLSRSQYKSIKKNRKAISLTYLSKSGKEIFVDVVPSRERNNFKRDGDLTLYKRNKSIFDSPSTFKTNPIAHRSVTVNRPTERKIIRLIKLWRDETKLNLPSSVIEVLVIKAFNSGYMASKITLKERLVASMIYVANYIENWKVRDVSNSSNTLCSGMNRYDREQVANQLLRDVNRIKQRPSYLKEIFQYE